MILPDQPHPALTRGIICNVLLSRSGEVWVSLVLPISPLQPHLWAGAHCPVFTHGSLELSVVSELKVEPRARPQAFSSSDFSLPSVLRLWILLFLLILPGSASSDHVYSILYPLYTLRALELVCFLNWPAPATTPTGTLRFFQT